jgi:hypothetical protein
MPEAATISGADLGREIDAIREEALEAGVAVAEAGGAADPARERRARELDERLEELWPAVDASPGEERRELVREWTDARMDLLFVLSGGTAPASLRLGHRLPRS